MNTDIANKVQELRNEIDNSSYNVERLAEAFVRGNFGSLVVCGEEELMLPESVFLATVDAARLASEKHVKNLKTELEAL